MNPIVKYGGLALLTVIFLSIIRSCGSGVDDVKIQEPQTGSTTGTTALETTAGEELRTVGSRQLATDNRVNGLEQKLGDIQNAVSKLSQSEPQVPSSLSQQLEKLSQDVAEIKNGDGDGDGQDSEEVVALRQQVEDLRQLVELGTNNATHVLNNGLKNDSDDHNPLNDEYEVNRVTTFDKEEVVWIGPVDEPDLVQNGKIVWDELSNYWDQASERIAQNAQSSKEDVTGIKVFTLPANSTLRGARLTGRMIGRIPGDGGTVEQPYGFKVVVPPESFIANGHELPEISHAFMGGFATGDLGLRCARGYITNMTFVFEDGTISQVGEPSIAGGGDTNYLAVLTDVASTECISGELKSDFVEYATTSGLLNAAEAAAQGAVASQTTTSNEGGTSTSSVTGSSGAVIAGSAGAGFVSDSKKWVNERWAKTFDAILVEIGKSVQIETKAQIEIDYDPQGRRTHHISEEELQQLMQ
ncbi:TPA: TIGR03752 family integrating conjugative element protein [Vibrio parahaemolyticus]|uniref:TIGR03752 family integrating conjugative element protein n=1 Tax=Vibrio parahaemolyticus TaxID=670 RepID=UPI002406CD0F|nr:TIGR03752 family integrating conjugative element protein [Vibrio parahaemolyticus]